jgi:hypothetical protein
LAGECLDGEGVENLMKIEREYCVCVDCYLHIAGNDLAEIASEIVRERVESSVHKLGGDIVIGDVGDVGFGKSPCQCCGSELHGDRYYVSQLKP